MMERKVIKAPTIPTYFTFATVQRHQFLLCSLFFVATKKLDSLLVFAVLHPKDVEVALFLDDAIMLDETNEILIARLSKNCLHRKTLAFLGWNAQLLCY